MDFLGYHKAPGRPLSIFHYDTTVCYHITTYFAKF